MASEEAPAINVDPAPSSVPVPLMEMAPPAAGAAAANANGIGSAPEGGNAQASPLTPPGQPGGQGGRGGGSPFGGVQFGVSQRQSRADRPPPCYEPFFDFLKFNVPVQMPKMIVIQNGRVSCLMIAMMVGMIIFLAWHFVITGKYLYETVPQATPIAWASDMPLADYTAGVAKDLASASCVDSTRRLYDFAYGKSLKYIYGDTRCIELPPFQRSEKVGASVVSFPTYFSEEMSEARFSRADCEVLRNTTCSGHESSKCGTQQYVFGKPCYSELGAAGQPGFQCRCSQTQNFLVAGAARQRLVLSHEYEDSDAEAGTHDAGASRWTTADVEQEKQRSTASVRPVVSVVETTVGAENGVYHEFDCGKPKPGECRFGPGEDVDLTLSQWGRVAGVDLDDATALNERAGGANGFQSVLDSGGFVKPLLRLTGMELTVRMNYFEPFYLDKDYGQESFGLDDSVVAKLNVHARTDWTGSAENAYGDVVGAAGGYALPAAQGSGANGTAGASGMTTKFGARHRYRYGVRFVFESGSSGKFGHFLVPFALSMLAILAVYMGFVQNFLKVFLTKGLGDTSRTYKRAQVDRMDLDLDAMQVCRCALTVSVRVVVLGFLLSGYYFTAHAFACVCCVVRREGAGERKENKH